MNRMWKLYFGNSTSFPALGFGYTFAVFSFLHATYLTNFNSPSGVFFLGT